MEFSDQPADPRQYLPQMVECPVCHGHGETAVPGTYGPTISPENLELVQCWLCRGDCEVTHTIAREFRRVEERE